MVRKTWIHLLLQHGRVPWVVIVVLLTVVLGHWAADARLERSNESMNAHTPAEQQVRQRFVQAFGSDEVIVMALRDPHLLDPDGLARLVRLGQRVGRIDGVRRVLSLADAVEVVAGEFGAREVPLLPEDAAPDRSTVEQALDRNPQWTGLLISADRRTAGLLIEIEDRPADDAFRPRIVETLRGLKLPLAAEGVEAHVTGITVQKYDTTRFVARDQRVMLPTSMLVLGLALAWGTRRISGVVLPLAVTGVSLIWTVGIHSALGFQLNIITSLLPPVVMVLSIATAIHIYQEWLALGSLERDRRRLAETVLNSLAAPCALTALTTALGLGSLATSDVPAVREFGIFGALGVMLSLMLNLTLLPVALSWLRPRSRNLARDSRVRPLLVRIGELTVRRPRTILAVTLAISVVALVGVSRVRNNTDLVRFLDPDSELVRDTLWVDQELVGTSALEILIERTDGGPLTSVDDLQRIDRLAHQIADQQDVTKVISITDTLARVAQAEWDLPRPELPATAEDVGYLFELLDASPQRDAVERLITHDRLRTRLAVRIHAIGSAEARRLVDRIGALATATLGDALSARPTGGFYTVVVDSNRLVSNQLVSFALAVATVFLVLALMLRSLRLLAAAVAPNLMPILWGAGMMGWVGIDLSAATAMVASVAIGIAVDGTIHYLARFRWENDGDVAEAVRRTTVSTGRVLLMASIILALGFWVGAFGSFRPTIWFSVLTGGAIMTALACDLLVLPACLVLTRPRPARMRNPG